jgi:hypothetical protein
VTLRAAVLRTRAGTGEFVDTTVEPENWSSLLLEHFALTDTLAR